jgi:hypothetical protein
MTDKQLRYSPLVCFPSELHRPIRALLQRRPMMRPKTVILILAINAMSAMCLNGCATVRENFAIGARELPKDQVVVLECEGGVLAYVIKGEKIGECDGGRRTSLLMVHESQSVLYLQPGTYEVSVAYAHGNYGLTTRPGISNFREMLPFSALPGHSPLCQHE